MAAETSGRSWLANGPRPGPPLPDRFKTTGRPAAGHSLPVVTDAMNPLGAEVSPDPDGVAAIPRSGGLAVVIPAKNEAERIATTVSAALAIEGVGLVVVVDDGS